MDRLLDFAARSLPPPGMVGLPLRLCPQKVQCRVLERALNQLFGEMIDSGEFEYLAGKRLAVEVSDMQLRWVIGAEDRRLVADSSEATADAVIRGRAVEFLLLAGQLEDPDTLFFQRRLEVSGDTVIGLTTRNLIDRLPVDELPMSMRIVLNRAARFGRRVRRVRESQGDNRKTEASI